MVIVGESITRRAVDSRAVPPLNLRMHEALQKAAQLMIGGDLERAALLCSPLMDDPRHRADALHVMGVLRSEQGAVEESLTFLNQAAALQPANIDLQFNRANVLLRAGRYDAARAAFEQVQKARPQDPGVLNNLGTCWFEQGVYDRAVDCYQQAVTCAPSHAGAWQNLAQAHLKAGRAAPSLEAAERSLALRADHFETRFTRARALLGLDRANSARESLLSLVDEHEARPDVMHALAVANLHCERPADALAVVDRALAADADSAALHVTRGSALVALGRGEDAVEAYRRAMALSPEELEAPVNLAQYYELANDIVAAEEAARGVLERAPRHAAAILVLARCRRRAGDYDGALAALELVHEADVDPETFKAREFEMGAVHEKRRSAEDAWPHFQRANRIAAALAEQSGVDGASYRAAVDAMLNWLSERAPAQWATSPKPARAPIFVVGFQRSGTTLLDAMLGAQAGFEVMEEPRTLSRVVARLGNYPERLAAMSDEEVATARRVYWETVAELGVGEAPYIVDKSPLGLVHGGLIHRLFPGASIVFALRHPYDVCLSCYMQDFALNAITANFTRLETTAALYAQVMTTWQRLQERLPLRVHTLRYESLVEEPVAELERLADFLDIDWEGGVEAHRSHVRQRGLIDTPSYHQVGESIYRDAAYRWRRYKRHLEPVLETLAPFANAFGYPQ